MNPIVEALTPRLDRLIYAYFPGNVEVRPRIRSMRFLAVAQLDRVLQTLQFNGGAIVLGVSASCSGLGANAAGMNAPSANEFFEFTMTVSGIAPWVLGYFPAGNPVGFSDGIRADAFQDNDNQDGGLIDRWFRPPRFVSNNDVLHVEVRNACTGAGFPATMDINVLIQTIEPSEPVSAAMARR